MEKNIGNINLKCRNCGGEQFSTSAEAKPEDDATCIDCGTTFKLDDLLADARQEAVKVADALADALRKALK